MSAYLIGSLDDAKVIDNKTSFSKAYTILKHTRYLISTADSELSFLAGYMGIPQFAFLNATTSVYNHQMNFFSNANRNYYMYSPFVCGGDKSEILKKLISLSDKVIAGGEISAPSSPPKITIGQRHA
jgi:hypothetical protein